MRARSRRKAFSKVDMLVVVTVIFILAAVVLASRHLSRPQKSLRVECAINLKQVGLAFRLWSGDCGDKYPMQALEDESKWAFHLNATNGFRYFQVMSNELGTTKFLVCPEETKRKAATNFTSGFDNRNLSYFAGLDADETMPGTFLAGDRNLTNGQFPANNLLYLQTNQLIGWTKELHNECGNVLMADGHVEQQTKQGLKSVLTKTGLVTNRILLPQ